MASTTVCFGTIPFAESIFAGEMWQALESSIGVLGFEAFDRVYFLVVHRKIDFLLSFVVTLGIRSGIVIEIPIHGRAHPRPKGRQINSNFLLNPRNIGDSVELEGLDIARRI